MILFLLLIFIIGHFQKLVILRIVAGQLVRRYLRWMVEPLGLLIEVYILVILTELLFLLLLVLKLMPDTQHWVDVSLEVGLGISFYCDHRRFVSDDRLLLGFGFVLLIQIHLALLWFLLLVLRRLALLLFLFLSFLLQSLLDELVQNLSKGGNGLLIPSDNITSLDFREILLRKGPLLHQHQ